MRTTDEAVQVSSPISAGARRWTVASILYRITGTFRRVIGGRRRNHVDELNDYGLRDIGMKDGRHAYDGLNRAARQDHSLREAHLLATMLAMGTGGR